MSTVDLARLQFALTSINHFLFVPVTIGLAFLTALLQTSWYRTKNPELLRLTRFFGTLLLINVAVGVVTGLVQEFEFGMNWSAYSRLVGNVFGAPLAMEGLAAFFLESTFLGLWLFGWDKLSRAGAPGLTSGWWPSGSMLSAAFIMAANSWMQHPVGYKMVRRQAAAGQHLGGVHQPGVPVGIHARACWPRWSPGTLVMLAVSAWQLRKGTGPGGLPPPLRLSLIVLVPAILLTMFVGRRARRDRGHVPADEDRGGRGAVDHLPAVLVLAVPDRRRQQRPDPDPDHRRSRTCCRCWPPTPGTARSIGLNPLQTPVRRKVRAGQLRAERVHPVLVDAGDGLPRRAGLAVRAVGAVAAVAQEARDRPGWFLLRRDLGRHRCRS